MAQYVVTGPVVVLPDTNGKTIYFYEGTALPDGLDQDRVAMVLADGLIAEVGESADSDKGGPGTGPDPATGPADGTAEEVLARVGDDKALARAALDAEQAKDKPREVLVGKLRKVAEK